MSFIQLFEDTPPPLVSAAKGAAETRRGGGYLLPLLFTFLIFAVEAEAQTRPPVRLDVAAGQIALIDRASQDTLRYAQAGDTIIVDVVVNSGKRQPLTGVQFHLNFDPAFLSPIDADTARSGLQPVRSEGLITRATIIANEFNTDNPNRYRGILYAEGLLSGSTTADSGRVASVSFRMLKPIPPGGDVIVSVEGDTVIFRSYYQTQTAVGLTFPLVPRNALHLTLLPPALNLPASMAMQEDVPLTLDLIPLAADPRFAKRQLRWTISARDSGFVVTVNDSTKTATIAPRRGFVGSTVLTFTATNPAGASAKGQATLQVNHVNRAPVILIDALTPRLKTAQDSTLTLDLRPFATDADDSTDALTWTVTGGDHVKATVQNRTVMVLTPTAGFFGSEGITFSVRDPQGASDRKVLSLTVTHPPIPGDFNRDGIVNFDDFFAFAQAFGTASGQPGFDPKFDLDGNGRVDLDDFFLFAANFGRAG